MPCSGTSVPGIGQPRRSPSPESQISPVSWTSSPVMSRPRIEIGRCRPPVVDARQLVAADDLAAADAIGVGQHDVEGLDLGMGVEKGFGFVDGDGA